MATNHEDTVFFSCKKAGLYGDRTTIFCSQTSLVSKVLSVAKDSLGIEKHKKCILYVQGIKGKLDQDTTISTYNLLSSDENENKPYKLTVKVL